MAKKMIDADKLQEAISNYNKAIQLLDEEIAGLNDFLAKLSADWDSPASKLYVLKIRNEAEKLKKTRSVIVELRKYSESTRNVFEAIDKFLRSISEQIANVFER